MSSLNTSHQLLNHALFRILIQVPVPLAVGLLLNNFSDDPLGHFILILIFILIGIILFVVLKGFKRQLEISEANNNYSIKIYDRKKLSDRKAYSIYYNFISKANSKIKIISPRKPIGYLSLIRERYFTLIYKLIEKKTIETNDFVYKRIIPENALSGGGNNIDKYLQNHASDIEKKYFNSIDIGCCWVKEWLIPINCIIVDDEHILLMLPQLCLNINHQVSMGDDCSLIIQIHDRKKSLVRIIEKQFDLLYLKNR